MTTSTRLQFTGSVAVTHLPARIAGHLYALAALLLIAAFAPSPAIAVSRSCGFDPLENTETVLCAPPSGPCTTTEVTLGANVEVTNGGCEFDLGGRTLVVDRTFEMVGFGFIKVVNAADVTITATGKLKARGDFVKPQGFIIQGGLISLTAAGAITHQGTIDVTGDPAGSIGLFATGDVTFAAGSEIRGNGVTSFVDMGDRFADGAIVQVGSLTGSARLNGDVAIRGTNQGIGGDLEVSAARDCEIGGDLDLTGGGSDGGALEIDVGDDVTITRSIDVSSRVGAGFGGRISVYAGTDELGGVRPGGDITIDGAVLNANGSASEQFGGDGGDVDMSAFGSVRLLGAGAAIHVDAASNFDGSGGLVDLIAADNEPYALGPLDGDIVLAGVISARGGAASSDGGFVALEAGRNLVVNADVDVSGDAAGGDFTVRAGGAITVNGTIVARGTSAEGDGGFVELFAGDAQGGDAGSLTMANDILAFGGASSGHRPAITLVGCTVTVEDGVTIDGHAGASPNGALGGSAIDLISSGPMRLGAGSQYLATPGGRIVTWHPDGQDPIIESGVVFAPPRIDSLPPFPAAPNCPVCGDGVRQIGERCDHGAENGIDGCCSDVCQIVDGDGDFTCDRDDPCPTDADNDSDGDGFCVGASFVPPAVGGDDPCTRFGGAGAWIKPKLVFGQLDAGPGRGTLSVKAAFDVSPGATLAPDVFGIQLRVASASGAVLLDTHVPGAAFSSELPVGWTAKGSPASKWTYVDKVNDPPVADGITKLVITDQSAKIPGRVRVGLVAKHGTYVVGSGHEPLVVTFELNDTAAPAGGTPGVGQCGEVRFELPPLTPSCRPRGGGKLFCK